MHGRFKHMRFLVNSWIWDHDSRVWQEEDCVYLCLCWLSATKWAL